MDKKIDDVMVQIAIERYGCTETDARQIIRTAQERHSSPVALLCRRQGMAESALLQDLAAALELTCTDLKQAPPSTELIRRVPLKIAAYYKFVPVSVSDHVMTIAVCYPPDIKKQDEIRTHLGHNITLTLAREADILETLNRCYGLGADTVEKIIAQKVHEPAAGEHAPAIAELSGEGQDASIEQLVNQIILEAYQKRATDIHIEPYRNAFRLRYRIDGLLHDAPVPDQIHRFIAPILSRIKLMANVNIVERRVPQDGRASVKVHNEQLDLRISCIPTPHGESIVIRILPSAMSFQLDNLGLTATDRGILEPAIQRPYGILFITGPTGSGKSTTLYACLSAINRSDQKIITLEDPIEYELEGITQIQVVPDLGFDFARGLRSMLRHDPDVMMVGEVRDLETAEIAIRVALTGHLVFSTLHTNDAASGITRLIDIGLEPYLVASSVTMFVAQRLVRLLCGHCRRPLLEISPALRRQIEAEMGSRLPELTALNEAVGCPECNQTGFSGRSAVYEMLPVSAAVQDLIMAKAPSEQIKRFAVHHGMYTLRQSGWLKVAAGLTTPAEVLRATPADRPIESGGDRVTDSAAIDSVPVAEKSKASPSALFRQSHPADKRVYERQAQGLLVRFRLFSVNKPADSAVNFEPEYAGMVKNISAGGLLFSCTERFMGGAILDMIIEVAGDEQPVQCLARVVRCVEALSEKGYDIAVCFLDLPNAERARINRHILQKTGTA